jgi:hypothetical protein
MIEEKNIDFTDLKSQYGDRKGFVFQGACPSSDDAIFRLSNTLLEKQVSNKLPEFFVRLNSVTIVIIYPEKCFLDMPLIYQSAKRMEMLGAFRVDIW